MFIELNKLSKEEEKLVNDKIIELKKLTDSNSLSKLLETLNLLSKFNLGLDVYSSAIVLFQIEKGLNTVNDFKFNNKNVEYIVKTISELEQFNFKSYVDEAQNIHKVFLSLVKNITVVILVLVKMLVKMRHLEDLPKDSSKLICEYARDIYVPLAARLGFSDIKGEMDDICLKFFQPQIYGELEDLIKTHWRKTNLMLKELKIIISNMLKELNVNGEIVTRQKHISSVYHKMEIKKVDVSEIYDFAALRVVVDTKDECYSVLGKIHSKFKPMAGRIKDYIANPKPNGYQSLHTTIIYTNGKPVEIQIKTKKMHEENEIGVSAHFLYKEKKVKKDILDERLMWVRNLMEKSKNISALEFVDALKMDLYPGKILVQTPKGKIVELPEEATVLDFAYAIHSELGNHCSGAKVNGKFAPISTPLKNNDKVEIISNPNCKGPSIDWLKLVKSPEAKAKINGYFKSKQKSDNIKKGKALLEKYINGKNFILNDLISKVNQEFLYKKFSVKNFDGLFAAVGYGSIKVEVVGNKLISNYTIKNNKNKNAENRVKVEKRVENSIVVENEKNFLFRFANCCLPKPADNIVAYTSRGRGLSIHKADCSCLKFLDKERILPARWADQNLEECEAELLITSFENINVVSKINKIIADNSIKIISINAQMVNEQTLINVKIKFKNINKLEKLLNKLNKMSYISNIKKCKK